MEYKIPPSAVRRPRPKGNIQRYVKLIGESTGEDRAIEEPKRCDICGGKFKYGLKMPDGRRICKSWCCCFNYCMETGTPIEQMEQEAPR